MPVRIPASVAGGAGGDGVRGRVQRQAERRALGADGAPSPAGRAVAVAGDEPVADDRVGREAGRAACRGHGAAARPGAQGRRAGAVGRRQAVLEPVGRRVPVGVDAAGERRGARRHGGAAGADRGRGGRGGRRGDGEDREGGREGEGVRAHRTVNPQGGPRLRPGWLASCDVLRRPPSRHPRRARRTAGGDPRGAPAARPGVRGAVPPARRRRQRPVRLRPLRQPDLHEPRGGDRRAGAWLGDALLVRHGSVRGGARGPHPAGRRRRGPRRLLRRRAGPVRRAPGLARCGDQARPDRPGRDGGGRGGRARGLGRDAQQPRPSTSSTSRRSRGRPRRAGALLAVDSTLATPLAFARWSWAPTSSSAATPRR